MDRANTALARVLLAAKVAGVTMQLSEDYEQPLKFYCESKRQQIEFLKRLFPSDRNLQSEEFSTLKEADHSRLQQAINRKVITGTIWSEESFDYGC